MGVEPLRAGAQRNLGRGPQRAIGAPSGDAAGPTEIRERSLSHPQILLQSRNSMLDIAAPINSIFPSLRTEGMPYIWSRALVASHGRRAAG